MGTVRRKRRFDGDSSANIGILTEHAHIHRGKGFTCSKKLGTVANNGVTDILFSIPSSVFPHLRVYRFSSSAAPADINLYSNPTIGASGTACEVQNLNKVSSNVSSVQVFTAASASAVGSFMEYSQVTGSKQEGGSEANATVEWDLNHETNYLLRYTNLSGAGATVGFFSFWYE